MGGDRSPVPQVQRKPLEAPVEGGRASEAQGHRPVQELLFVSSGHALRCSGSALTSRWAGGVLPRGLRARFLCAQPCRVPARVGPMPWEGPAHETPMRGEEQVRERPL